MTAQNWKSRIYSALRRNTTQSGKVNKQLMEKTFKHRHIYVTASADALRRVAVSRTTVEITSAIKPPRNDVIDLLTSK
jgi:hypothetical protein